MEKIKALNLAKDCYSMKLELLTNATVVDEAIRFAQSNQNPRIKIVNSASRAYGTERRKEKDELLSPSSAEVTVNNVF